MEAPGQLTKKTRYGSYRSTADVSCETCASKDSSIFCSLTHEGLFLLSHSKSVNVYKKGDVIFHEGSRPLGLFCVHGGKVKIYKTGLEGKEQIVRLAKEGDLIGYRSLISGELYSASATAVQDAMVCYIPQSIFFHLLQTDVEFSMRTLRLICDALKEAENQVTHIAQKPLRQRLAETILMLKNFYGVDPADDNVISNTLSREELANLVGTAPACVMRLLSEFRKDKIIDLKGKKIKITDQNKLVRLAQLFD